MKFRTFPTPEEIHNERIRSLIAEHSRSEDFSEADMPVPIKSPSNSKSENLVRSMRLGQRIGVLLFLHRNDLISEGGEQRLFYLQAKASIEAIASGLSFCYRLESDPDLLRKFWRSVELLNLKPRSHRFRKYQTRRVGVGYRDKGTLPENDLKARRRAVDEAYVSVAALPEKVQSFVSVHYRSCLTEDEEWLDIFDFSELITLEDKEKLRLLLSPM
jgi:hypothetical protein